MRPGEEIPLDELVSGSRPPYSRDVPECQQNGNRNGSSDTLTAARQSDGDARPDWQQDGLLASVDPGDIRETERLRAMVDTQLHEALDAEDFEEAIRRVLAAGTPLGALDHAGRTALHLCVHRRALGPFKVLLGYEGSVNLGDADSCPVLNVAILHKWVDGARAALAAGADVTAYEYTPIHLAVTMNELELLEEMLDERRQAVDIPNLDGQTALYTAVRSNDLPAVKILVMKGASGGKISKLLHEAVDHPNLLNYVLHNTDVADTFDCNGHLALHKAVIKNCAESVYFLLKKFNNPKLKTLSGGMTALHLAAEHSFNQIAQVILRHDPSTVKELDDYCQTPLEIAVNNRNKALILMLLKSGAVLSTKSNKKITVIELLAIRLLDCSNFIELIFDQFIETNEICITIGYEFLTDTEGPSQINVIKEFVRCGQSKLLVHPLIVSLLFLKWRHLLPVFCLIIGIYSAFIISFSIFVVHTFYYRDIDSRNYMNSSDKIESRTQGLFEMYDEWYWLLIALIYNSLSAMFGLELFCIYWKRLRYFGRLESWVKLCVLVLGAAVPYAVTVAEPADWQRHAACAALLLGWLQAMFLLAQFPYWGTYVLMFGKVAINLLKVLVTAVFLIIAFSFCFMILISAQFRSQSPFDGPFPAFVKTLVMMSSEFDYEDLFGPNHDNELQETRTVVRLLFILFVVFLAMVLMNFMIGAAISDIKDLSVTGSIKRLEMQVELLSILDYLVHGGLLDKIFRTFAKCSYHNEIIIKFGIPVKWFAICSGKMMLMYDSEARFQFYSKTFLFPLHKVFVDLAKKNECKYNNPLCCSIGAGAVNYSCCSDQIKVDGKQLTLDIASMKQMISNMAASIKELTCKRKTHGSRNTTSRKTRTSRTR